MALVVMERADDTYARWTTEVIGQIQGRRSRPYRNVISQQWPYIVTLLRQYANKKPVMLRDIREQRVYAFPFKEFRAELNARSQGSLTRQYERALAEGNVVAFVRDNEQKKLVSYSLRLPNEARSPSLTVRRRDQRK